MTHVTFESKLRLVVRPEGPVVTSMHRNTGGNGLAFVYYARATHGMKCL